VAPTTTQTTKPTTDTDYTKPAFTGKMKEKGASNVKATKGYEIEPEVQYKKEIEIEKPTFNVKERDNFVEIDKNQDVILFIKNNSCS